MTSKCKRLKSGCVKKRTTVDNRHPLNNKTSNQSLKRTNHGSTRPYELGHQPQYPTSLRQTLTGWALRLREQLALQKTAS